MKGTSVIPVALLVVAAFAAPAFAAKPPQRGAVKLPPSMMKAVAGVQCGKVAGTWIPGTRLPRGYFISHTRRAANLTRTAKTAKGKAAKARAKGQAARYRSLARSQASACLGTAGAAPPETITAARAQTRFDFRGARALAVVSVGARSSRGGPRVRTAQASGLLAMTGGGAFRETLVQGDVVVESVTIAADGAVYAVFDNTTPAVIGDSTCMLARIEPTTGVPTCIDKWVRNVNRVVVDDQGTVYYSGVSWESGSATAQGVIRQWSAAVGSNADVVPPGPYQCVGLLATPGPYVFFGTRGMAGDTSAVIRPNGSRIDLGPMGNNYYRFPDGNVYASGVYRFLVGSGTADPTRWYDMRPEYFATTSTKRVYGSGQGSLSRLYPASEFADFSLPPTSYSSTAGGLVAVQDDVFWAHANQLGVIRDDGAIAPLVLYGPTSASGELQFFELLDAGGGKLLFQAVRKADQADVVGEVDVATGTVSVISATPRPITDFAVFPSGPVR